MDEGRVEGCQAIQGMLTPFVDGEASPAERSAIERHVRICPSCAALVDEERGGQTVLRARRAALAVAAPAGLRARCAPPRRRARHVTAWRWVPLSLAASLLIAVAGAFVYSVNHPVEALAAELAVDHMKCFKLQDTSATPDAVELAQTWKRERGWAIPVVTGIPEDGIQLVGLRRCLTSEGQMAHLLFMAGDKPLSVYIWPRVVAPPGDLEVMGQRAVIWASNGRMFAVVGAQPPAVIAEMCEHVRVVADE
jgi:anti-sigma factor RsiW